MPSRVLKSFRTDHDVCAACGATRRGGDGCFFAGLKEFFSSLLGIAPAGVLRRPNPVCYPQTSLQMIEEMFFPERA